MRGHAKPLSNTKSTAVNKSLRVLIVEDSEDDTLLVLRELRRGGFEPFHAQVDTREAMGEALQARDWDIVIADHTMPGFSSTGALGLVQEKGVDIPFIIVSGSIGEDCAVAAMKAGAHDYVGKSNLARLAPVVERELRDAEERRKRRRAEAALNESESILRSFFDSPGAMRGVVEVIGKDILHLVDNEAATAFFGRAGESTRNCLASEMGMPAETTRIWIEYAMQSMKACTPVAFEYVQRIEDKDHWFQGTIAYLSTVTSDHPRFAYSMTDVTERKRTEEELQKYDRLRHLETLRDGLVHMVVHDMRTPLSAITGSLELLKMALPSELDADARDAITVANNNVRAMNEMVTQLLHVSRFEAGQMPLHKKPCDIAEVARSVVKVHKHLCNGHHLQFRTAGPCKAVCDEDIVRRIIGNLLVNALKFTPKDGEVTVSVLRESHCIRCMVSDTGPGIPPNYRQKIFDKFSQVENRGQQAGVGLGLAFCKLAAEAHGGEIGVNSDVGKGSCFWFSLPVDPASAT